MPEPILHLFFVPGTRPGGGTISHASSMALRAYECGSCLHAVPCWEDLARIGCRSPRRSTAPSPKARRGSRNSGSIPGFPTFPCGAALGVPHLSRYFRIVKCFRAQRGRYGASSHDHDRIDGRDDAGFPDDDLNRVVSVLLASIIDILPHDTSVFYRPPRRSDASQANNGIG